MSEPLVIIGNGMAAARLCEELVQRALGRYAIAVVGKEPRLAYNRVLLSSVLAGEVAANDLTVKPADWWRKHGVTLCYGTAATAVDTAARMVALEDGTTLPFAKLVFSTGSRAIRLPLPGADLGGVMTFRDLADTESLVNAARRGSRAVVIGGGLLGIEAAYGLAKAGVDVTLVHLMDRLMERQLDACAAALLKRAIEAKGIKVELEAATAKLVGGEGRVEAVELKDARVLPADTVVIAVGIAPNVEIARTANLTVNRGIVVDDTLATSDPNVFAVGECAEHRGTCYGLVEPANDQARVLAERLAGRNVTYTGSVNATNLKVSGVHVFSAGDFLGAAGTEAITLADSGLGTYRKLVIKDECLVGAVLYGDTADARWHLELLRSGASIEAIRQDLVFGRAFVERKASTKYDAESKNNRASTHGLHESANASGLPPAHIVAVATQIAAHATT
jgi:nitrite reductase (NADH) large subunit